MNTREEIILSAVNIFARKGRFGAKMNEIAKDAGVNKALVYYYYTDKNNLYIKTLDFILQDLYTKICSILDNGTISEDPVAELEKYLFACFSSLSNNENVALIINNALMEDPELVINRVKGIFNHAGRNIIKELYEVFRKGVKKNLFLDISLNPFIINFISMLFIYHPSKRITCFMEDITYQNKMNLYYEFEKDVICYLIRTITTK